MSATPYDPELLAMLALRLRWGLGDRAARRVVDTLGSATRALRRPKQTLRVIGPRAKTTLGAHQAMAGARDIIRAADAAGLRGTCYGGADYPPRFGVLSDPPQLLWTLGDVGLLALPAVAVVGARRATESGRRTAHEIGAGLAEAGLVVVSGLALGIDGAAHEGALAAGGLTLAVLGSGADRPTPRSHRRLARRIARCGLIVSEFDPGTDSAPFHFPRRNRLIAALGTAVVVVEAAERSGALITVDHALDLGRTVFAVPGPLDRTQSAGTNRLIRDGASVVTSVAALVEDVLSELRIELGESDRVPPSLAGHADRDALGAASAMDGGRSADVALPTTVAGEADREADGGTADAWRRLCGLFDDGPQALDELVRRSGLPVSTVAAELLEREVGGEVRAEGVRYRRVGP